MSEVMIWVNGRLLPQGEAMIDARDRGWTLGDGLFETIRAVDRRPLRLGAHLSRLRSGAAILGIDLPWSEEDLSAIIAETLLANTYVDAVVRLTVSRGIPAARGLLPSPAPPTLVVHVQPFTPYAAASYLRGIHVFTSTIRRNQYSPVSNVKALGYLDNILARKQAADQGADDALLLNTSGELACASAANLFVVVDGVVLTPPLSAGVLPGTVRAAVLALAPRLGIAAEERSLLPPVFGRASEAFLTNALMGVMPLTVADAQAIGNGEPGPVASTLARALEAAEGGT